MSIQEVLLGQFPPEIRTTDGEVLFVEHAYKEQLRQFAEVNAIPAVKRVDIWGLLLEEFLDTVHDGEDREKTLRTLETCGITRTEVKSIREAVSGVMISYNFHSMLCDWFHLGLYDVLSGYSGILTGDKFTLPVQEYAAFYKSAMVIAGKGKLLSNGA
ncbi:hypothetical protein [Paenibacillus sp. GCM10027626]|uniref:hypothetical protein n=1 Tax=Paenibacillus sp. GCM10027626 TaxID=3273411 RepID=UPI0036368C68